MPVEAAPSPHTPTEPSPGTPLEPGPGTPTDRSLCQRLTDRARSSTVFWVFLALVILICVFAVASPPGTFVSVFNAQTLASDSATFLVLAAGATFVIISRGLDISIGSIFTFSAALSLIVMRGMGEGGTDPTIIILVGFLVAIAAGIAWGAINGVLVAYLELNPFVVTLGTLGAALGFARLLTDGANESGVPTQLQENIGLAEPLGIPLPFILGVLVITVLGIVLARTRFGEHTYLIGSNPEAARRGGISVARTQLMIYVLSGATAGFAAFIELARFDVAEVGTGHLTALLAALSAVVIGGASLMGGVGTMLGTVVGVFIPVVLNNGLIIVGVQRFWQEIVVGAILIAAVWFDHWRRSREDTL